MAIKWRTYTQVQQNSISTRISIRLRTSTQVELNFYQKINQVEDFHTGRTQFLPEHQSSEYQSSGGLPHRQNSISTRISIKWRTSTQVELNFSEHQSSGGLLHRQNSISNRISIKWRTSTQVEINFYQNIHQVEDFYTGINQFLPEYQSIGGLLHRQNSISFFFNCFIL